MAETRRRGPSPARGADGPLVRALIFSALLHAIAITLVLLAPHRLQPAPPTAYTVDIVDPGAIGGKLLAGPIGGGVSRQAPKPAPEAPKAEPPPPEEPEVVAKAEPPEPEQARAAADDTMPLGLARATPTPLPTRRAQPTARATATAAPARSRAAATVATTPRYAPPSPRVSPKAEARGAEPGAKETPRAAPTGRAAERGQPTPAPDLDSQIAVAIKGVESQVEQSGTPGLTGTRPGGGMEGTEQRLARPPGVGGEGPGGGGTLRSLEFVTYYNQMLNRIKESWTYVGERSDLRVTVRFSILESGEITAIRLVERSGDPGYDASVERAVKRASPLGAPPEAYRKDFADVELMFRPSDLASPPRGAEPR